jgi:hypothetical protein
MCNWIIVLWSILHSAQYNVGYALPDEECIYFPNCAQLNPDKHKEYQVLQFDYDREGRTFLIQDGRLNRVLNSGALLPVEGVPVSFTARHSCTAVLYMDDSIIFSAAIEMGQQLSVTLANMDVAANTTKVLQLRAILPGSAGSTFESSEINVTLLRSPSQVQVSTEQLSRSVFTPEPTTGGASPFCVDPLREVSAEDGGAWRGDWFAPHRCALRHFGAAAVRECLTNRTLLFAGDSMVRHVFVGAASLVVEDPAADLGAAREGEVLHIDEGTPPAVAADIRRRCSRRMRYVNHIFCEGRIRTRFDLAGGGRLEYFGVWGFRHRNGLLRELYRRVAAGQPPDLLVVGVGSHELAAVRRLGTEEGCPDECPCGLGFTEWFDTLRAVLEGDAVLRAVPAVMVLPAAQNEALKPPDYAWQTNDLVLLFNARAVAILDAAAAAGDTRVPGPVRAGGAAGRVGVFDPFWMTAARASDSVDSVHYGASTNAMLAQVLFNHFCSGSAQPLGPASWP